MQIMRRIAVGALCFIGAACVGTRAADEAKFSATVSGADFSGAGLGKLTPAELARLDGLVRDFKTGALEQARRDAAAAAEASARAEAKVARAEAEARAARADASAKAQLAESAEKKAEKGLLARAKVLLTPGTEIEYSTVESRIVGEFRGWEGRTSFRLENGQRWQTAGESTYVSPPLMNPAMKIVPGMLGSFWMTVEGIKPRVKVTPITAK